MRIVELSSIIDEERTLVDHIVAVVGYDINAVALKLTYQDLEGDAVVISSTPELTYAIRQCYDKGIMKFVGNVRHESQFNNTLPQAVVPAALSKSTPHHDIPKDLIIDFPTIRFNPSRAAFGLALADDNRRVTQTVNLCTFKCVYLMDGITSGCKYWSFKIINRGSIGDDMMIGVSDSSINLTQSIYPGQSAAPGCSLYLHNGHFYHSGTSVASANVALVKTATVIGVLLNMNDKTVTFFADGKHVGSVGADTNVLTRSEYFPVIALRELGQSVEVMDLAQPK
jgi:SPRY domain